MAAAGEEILEETIEQAFESSDRNRDGYIDRREYYNESVNLNNVRIEQFPDVIIARWFGFSARDLLEFSEEEKQDVDMKTLFT